MNNIKCIKFPKIEQFRNVVSNMNRRTTFIGLDDNGDAIYDNTIKKPTLEFVSSVKLHGTNSGISFTNKLGLWTQSRNNAFNLENVDSHMGFTFFVNSNKDFFIDTIKKLSEVYNIDLNENAITIYSEWVGKGIQKGVGISTIDKSMFIFAHFKVSPFDEDISAYWLPTTIDNTHISNTDERIYNILDFKCNDILIDFNMPQMVQNELGKLTQEVEDECPVAKHFGHSGVGEGNVWTSNTLKLSRDTITNTLIEELLDNVLEDNKVYYFSFNNLKLKCVELNYEKHISDYILIKELLLKSIMFSMKIKGEKHSVSKVKTLASVDVEKINSIQKFVDYSVTRNRFEQGLKEVFSSPEEYNRKRTGDILRWIVNDIMSEEMDVLVENELEPKDVNKYISAKARDMFFEEIDKVYNL